MALTSTAQPSFVVVSQPGSVATVVLTVFLIVFVIVMLTIGSFSLCGKDQEEDQEDDQEDDGGANPGIQRMETVVASPVGIDSLPSDLSASEVPTAHDTGIRTQETVEADLTMPPVVAADMEIYEDVPVAQTLP